MRKLHIPTFILALVGASLVTTGVSMISEALGIVVAGLFIIAISHIIWDIYA